MPKCDIYIILHTSLKFYLQIKLKKNCYKELITLLKKICLILIIFVICYGCLVFFKHVKDFITILVEILRYLVLAYLYISEITKYFTLKTKTFPLF